ncbi:hypothetical protein O181_012872 [Austropuccinia psidii MF-1]|uniref:Uncharacterized protein n=1 Tax=Austropuccinia psidii MF-1 TaxID=1389203 RepID=A0A9Q3GNE9_9BASI|nr:hypothetical protein [Austropuccinia psidii MF-1]
MKHGQQEVKPGISLRRTWSKLPEDLFQRDRLQRPYDNHQGLESYQAAQTPGGKGTEDKGESSHYPSYRRIRENQATIHAIEEQLTQTGNTQRVTILHHHRKFPGEDKDTTAKTRPLFIKCRASQTQ